MTRGEAGRKKRRRTGEVISRLLTKVVDKDPWIMDINDDATLTMVRIGPDYIDADYFLRV